MSVGSPSVENLLRIMQIKKALENYVGRMTLFGMCVECNRAADVCANDEPRRCGCPPHCDVSEARQALNQ